MVGEPRTPGAKSIPPAVQRVAWHETDRHPPVRTLELPPGLDLLADPRERLDEPDAVRNAGHHAHLLASTTAEAAAQLGRDVVRSKLLDGDVETAPREITSDLLGEPHGFLGMRPTDKVAEVAEEPDRVRPPLKGEALKGVRLRGTS